MTKVHNIDIKKADVFLDVQKHSHYAGSKTDNGFEHIALTDAQYEILEPFWEEGKVQLDELMKHYISDNDEGEDYTRELYLPDNWDASLGGSLTSAAKSFLVNHITSRWFRYVKADFEEPFLVSAEGSKKMAYRLLYARNRPKRVHHHHNHYCDEA